MTCNVKQLQKNLNAHKRNILIELCCGSTNGISSKFWKDLFQSLSLNRAFSSEKKMMQNHTYESIYISKKCDDRWHKYYTEDPTNIRSIIGLGGGVLPNSDLLLQSTPSGHRCRSCRAEQWSQIRSPRTQDCKDEAKIRCTGPILAARYRTRLLVSPQTYWDRICSLLRSSDNLYWH